MAQRLILAARPHSTPVHDRAGRRIDRVPPDLALGPALVLGAEDTLLTAGSGWSHLDLDVLAAMKQTAGFRFVALCYDIIPITHPAFWHGETVALVTSYWRRCLPLADLVVVNAQCIARDLRAFAGRNNLAAPATAVLPLGAAPPRLAAATPLPAGLQGQRFALFVSTIEPRKGHATLLAAWRRLLARDIPQRHGFRLVFVGQVGWMVDAVMQELANPPPGVIHLQGIDNATLDSLYAAAAFLLYPSEYEGFGLPIIEAFGRGKAVLASTGGALPETVGALSPCLPPGDPAAWEAAMAEWIVDPATRAPWEARIREEFIPLAWDRAAADILDAAIGACSKQRAET